MVRGVRAVLRRPRAVAGRVARSAGALAEVAMTGLQPAPATLFNVPIGPHRRFTWVRGDLDQFKAVKNSLGGTDDDLRS